MNMAELLKLKDEFLKKIRYGTISPDDEIKKLPKFETSEEIISQEQTAFAKDNIEKTIEDMVVYLGSIGLNYDLIFINLEVKCFVKEYAIRQYQGKDDSSTICKNKFNINDILDDYISFKYEINILECIENGDWVYPASSEFMKKLENIFKPKKRFIVKYSNFIAMITELGYSVILDDTNEESPSFEKIKSMIANRDSVDLVIGLDFRKKENVPTK